MTFASDSLSVNAQGGTELMKFGLRDRLDPELLKEFQIFTSRVEEELDETKIRIYWLHDLPGDPASEHLHNGGWKKFHKLVFTSNWQMQAYIKHYQIPWSKCIVLQNAIDPIPEHDKPDDGIIRLGYWSTPHRGLNILLPVFEKLCEKYDNLELDVYSSFKLYGWEDRDEPFKPLFDQCREHPKINYFGTVDNETLRKGLERIHIHAYPSTWSETSCITLMEAMSAGMVCVHSNLAALYETSANWTVMYQYQEDLSDHASIFYHVLDGAIQTINDPSVRSRVLSQQSYANVFYNWGVRRLQWDAFLRSMLNEDRSLPEAEEQFFQYRA